ncbi:hypothetical protein N657DRAFT_498349 [Parathielavia appendiculata]|uniref:Uncharacterized protein n=1 Tax=Parathielavia appendiculata TaxID=2587402 RepID=A0AAN6TX26_9PEZI|nr:hypothetical protein N657DRAFT_498349 [Parathielavia appendiculata]
MQTHQVVPSGYHTATMHGAPNLSQCTFPTHGGDIGDIWVGTLARRHTLMSPASWGHPVQHYCSFICSPVVILVSAANSKLVTMIMLRYVFRVGARTARTFCLGNTSIHRQAAESVHGKTGVVDCLVKLNSFVNKPGNWSLHLHLGCTATPRSTATARVQFCLGQTRPSLSF